MKHGLLLLICSVLFGLHGFANDTLTRGQIYNFDVGDTFDYEIGNPLSGVNDYERKVISAKQYSANTDTLWLTVLTIYPSLWTEVKVITGLNEYAVYSAPDTSCDISYITAAPTSSYNGRTINSRHISCHFWSDRDTFAEGLGLVYTSQARLVEPAGVILDFITRLVFFSKDGETWGTPYYSITGIHDQVGSILSYSIKPNPASSSISITTDENLVGYTISVTDLTGRNITQTKLTSANTQLSTEEFSAGLYLVTINSGEYQYTRKLVIEK